jgi:hypothetical protein
LICLKEVPKLHTLAAACNLDKIKMTQLMEGDLIENIKRSVAEDKIDFVVMGTSVSRTGMPFCGGLIQDVIMG